MKKILKHIKWLSFITILTVVFINGHINQSVKWNLYDINSNIPQNTYGLVLGTSKYVVGGGKNIYFEKRIQATAKLFEDNKIDTIIVSGDNREANYDEPALMKASLIAMGVPSNVIVEDKYGINTLQSIKNFKKRYHNKRVTIITQKTHNQRAVYYALKNQVSAIGYNALGTSFFDDPKTHFREWLAKVKAFIV